jgi:4-hydroxythreonine-4-phosphate dehydrogenase
VTNELRIAVTSGDQDGIGPEVTAKALAKIGPRKGVRFFLWRSPAFPKKYLALLDKRFYRKTVHSWPEAFKHPASSYKQLIDINSSAPPPRWVETSAEAGREHHIDALVTAPLSKTLILSSGMKDIGHTEILARVTEEKDLFMAFWGSKFNVLLVTGHLPLDKASQALSAPLLEKALRAANQLALRMKGKKNKSAKARIALVGFNPHAGETGLLGSEEKNLFLPVMEKLSNTLDIDGPLVPDAAYLEVNWKKYDIYVAPYHDQGLIPFKMAHAHKGGCHLTMGLPFVRTSVEHGTAKDIFGKNKADSSSMQDALLKAILLSQNSFKPDEF